MAWGHGLVRIEKTDLELGRCRAGGRAICDRLAEFVSSYEFFRSRRNHTKQERVRALCKAHARRVRESLRVEAPPEDTGEAQPDLALEAGGRRRNRIMFQLTNEELAPPPGPQMTRSNGTAIVTTRKPS